MSIKIILDCWFWLTTTQIVYYIAQRNTSRLLDFTPDSLFLSYWDMEAFSSLHTWLKSSSLWFSTDNWPSNVTNVSVCSSDDVTPIKEFGDGDTAASKLLMLNYDNYCIKIEVEYIKLILIADRCGCIKLVVLQMKFCKCKRCGCTSSETYIVSSQSWHTARWKYTTMINARMTHYFIGRN